MMGRFSVVEEQMGKQFSVCMSFIVLAAVCFGAQDANSYIGTWSGSWDGAGSGGFELTLEKGKDASLTGRVSVTGEPTYKATIRTLSFDGPKMTAIYDFPP